jgi:ribosome-binding factor A
MVDRPRARKMAVRIRQLAAETIERQIKDPRLALVTITDAQLTPDLREAKVFYTVYGDEAAWADSTAALASATGVVRAAVGRSLSVRFTPTIEFVADYVPSDARRVEALLAEARAADAVVAEVRTGKEPAGEPDPYKHGVDDDTAAESEESEESETAETSDTQTSDSAPAEAVSAPAEPGE